jgi:5-formyltetrahydrofolate cyclo-ligase
MRLSKPELRALIRAARPKSSDGLTDQLLAFTEGAKTIASFSPLSIEPDVADFNDRAVARGQRLLLPKIEGDSLSWADPGEMQPGRYGILSPTGAPADLALADLVLLPALAVDQSGVRLGQGGGFYDRTLASLRPGQISLVAVVFDDEVFDSLPVEEHDIRVSAAVTPSRIWHFKSH